MGFEARGTSLYFLGACSTIAAVVEKPLNFFLSGQKRAGILTLLSVSNVPFCSNHFGLKKITQRIRCLPSPHY